MPDRSRSPAQPGEPLRRPPRDYAEDAVYRRRRTVRSRLGWAVFFAVNAATPIVFAIVLFLVWRHS